MIEDKLFQWSDKYRVGDSAVDEEHKVFFTFLQRLADEVEQKQSNSDLVVVVLVELLEYTQHHFREEEQLMQKHNYEHYLAHMKSHISLVKRIEDLIEELREGSLVLNFQVLLSIKEWLETHFYDYDLTLAKMIPHSNEISHKQIN